MSLAALQELNIDTKPLYRPHQLADALDERATLEEKMRSPHIQDKGEVGKQIRRLDKSLAEQTPKPFVGKEIDKAVKLEAELRSKILEGMPSKEEMRKAPPGAVDKHMNWEKAHKKNLLMWKTLQLRLNPQSTDRDLCNFEKYRPNQSTLGMDNAQVRGADYYLPPPGAGLPVLFSDAQLSLLAKLAPDIAERLAMLTNEQRANVKEALNKPEVPPAATEV